MLVKNMSLHFITILVTIVFAACGGDNSEKSDGANNSSPENPDNSSNENNQDENVKDNQDNSDTCKPTEEICDGKDNDCDGDIDEELGTTMCGVGECQVIVDICVNGEIQECEPVEPEDEICDNKDNDCDGETDYIDEITCGFGECEHSIKACVMGKEKICDPMEGSTIEICDGSDNDCDNETDEELGIIICGIGECAVEINLCINGVEQVCIPGVSVDEICDGLDNDCDGETDEDLTAPDAELTESLCKNQIKICLGENSWQEPDYTQIENYEETEITCDEIDNDCDGDIDEGDLCGADHVCLSGYCTILPAYILITAGYFTMGSPPTESDSDSVETQHEVTLTYDFEIQNTEVTQEQFEILMGYNPSYFSSCGKDCPVEEVDWYEALSYCNALSMQTGYSECFDCSGIEKSVECTLKSQYSKPQDCPGYRLPTEAEWEYAARAGTTTAYYCGDSTSCLGDIAWYGDNADLISHPAGQKMANDWGLYDMSGNEWEWTWDWKGSYEGDATDPVGPSTGSTKVLRGGSFRSSADGCRSAYRDFFRPYGRSISFRPVRTIQ